MTAWPLAVTSDLVVDCGKTYEGAPTVQRRLMNQSLFSKIIVGVDDVVVGLYTDEYEMLLNDSIRELAHVNRQPEAGSLPLITNRCAGRPKNARTPTFAGRGSRID